MVLNWKRRQAKDPFVKQAKKENYRARSVYKLEEINRQYHLLENAKSIVELGSAPGAWTQYTLKATTKKQQKNNLHQSPTIISVDLLAMPAINGVNFIQGNFTDKTIQSKIKSSLNNEQADLVLSDMAPNMSGIRSVDDARAINLCEAVLQFSDECLSLNGHLVCKAFHGAYFEDFLSSVKTNFHKTHCVKPLSSRPKSREIYIVALRKRVKNEKG